MSPHPRRRRRVRVPVLIAAVAIGFTILLRADLARGLAVLLLFALLVATATLADLTTHRESR